MTSARRSAFILCVTLLNSGCTSVPRISEYPKQPYEGVFAAPLVVVGVADSDTRVGAKRPSKNDPNYPMQLHRVRIQVENVLRGELSDSTVWAFYFGFAGGFDGPRPLGFGREPSRRIFWLRRDAGVLRMACDGWDDCTMFVESGAHPGYRPEPGRPLAYALADILLTRGQGEVSDIKFAREVAWGARATIPEDYLLKKYTQMALTEKPPIRAAACSQIWIFTQDSMSLVANRQNAMQALGDTGCRCIDAPRGNPRCE